MLNNPPFLADAYSHPGHVLILHKYTGLLLSSLVCSTDRFVYPAALSHYFKLTWLYGWPLYLVGKAPSPCSFISAPLCPQPFQINVRLSLSSSVKSSIGIWIGIAMNLLINFGENWHLYNTEPPHAWTCYISSFSSGFFWCPSVTFYNFLHKGLSHLLLDLFSSNRVFPAFMTENFLSVIFSNWPLWAYKNAMGFCIQKLLLTILLVLIVCRLSWIFFLLYIAS